MTLDQAAAVVKVNDARGNPTQSNTFSNRMCSSILGCNHIGQCVAGELFRPTSERWHTFIRNDTFSFSEIFLSVSVDGRLAASINVPVSRLNYVSCFCAPLLTVADKLAGRQVVNTVRGY